MTEEEAKAFEEKMLKLTQVLEDELMEIEAQQTKLNVPLSFLFPSSFLFLVAF